MSHSHSPSHGIALLIAATACFATLDTGTKFISATVPLALAIWVRYLFQALFTGFVLLPKQGGKPFGTRHPVLQVIRALMLVLSSSLAFFSLKHIQVGEFTAIVMISPLLITLLSAIALKEHVSFLRWVLVAGGFLGVLVVIRPGGEAFQWAMLLPLALVVTNAAFQTLTSKLSKTDSAGTTHFITGCVGVVVTTLLLPFFWQNPGSLAMWATLVVLGALSTAGHYLLIVAYSRAPAAALTPYLYFQIPFATLGGWLAFAHRPDGWALAGFGIIAVCGALGTWVTAREKAA
jgi:drug/metabolite transporter (DMT)-like permease